MSQKQFKSDEKPAERRKWGKRPTYPFVDSTGVLVTKNRRMSIDIRDDAENQKEQAQISGRRASDKEILDNSDTAPELPSILRDNDLTNAAIPTLETSTSLVQNMELSFQKWKISLSVQEPRCSLGRDQNCDLVILNRFSSRRHGRLEWRNGQFYFCDHSFNGTYIDFDDGRTTHICRDECILSGSGVLSLGKPSNIDKDFIVRFTIS
ncbi:MAG: FHA domain-containing protein [Gammaproteobacteria bacterium]|nr:FHA domain-containing protein [Gammaproteobacteria bacterium]